MIDKKIHYCWFGGNEKPQTVINCLSSWQKYCPNFEIVEWNEENYDCHKIDYLEEAYRAGKWAFVSDYARLDIIYKYGGIYLDTDVELIRPLDELLSLKCFMASEDVLTVNTGLGFGSEKGNELIKENMSYYENNHFVIDGKYNLTTCVEITTQILRKRGLGKIKQIIDIDGNKIYPKEYFCPLTLGSKKELFTENTYAIHHYDASWKSQNFLIKKIEINLIPLKKKIKHLLDSTFGDGTYGKFKSKFRR